MLLIKSLNLNSKFFLTFFLAFSFCFSATGEEAVDIWNEKKDKTEEKILRKNNISQETRIDFSKIEVGEKKQEIKISDNENTDPEIKLVGLYEPQKNDLNLDMWSSTDGDIIKDTLARIDKIKLSKFSEEIFVNTILTYSYPPKNKFSQDEFLKLKLNWLIKNNKINLIENFLNNNSQFSGKSKLIKYLVDFYIASADISEGCKKANFINKEIKDNYLEKFRIYCLILDKKQEEAQLNFDLLREEGRSDKFFNDKILFLLGMKEKANKKILDNNLLNFYLSSVTVEDFKYDPTKKTNKNIWKYLNASNLISINYTEDKETMKKYEIAANEGTFDQDKIFEFYKAVPFHVNQLINADTVYKSLNGYESRSLIYQKILLSDNTENKLNLLFLLKDLFEKDKLTNVYTKHLSDILKKMDPKDIPDNFVKIVKRNIISEDVSVLGKIKYDDKVLHRSKVIKIFTEKNPNKKKIKKDFSNVYKKIKRNKKYFFSIKDVILLETLSSDGLEIPKELDINKLSENLTIPTNINLLVKNNEIGLLMLKLVEIIGSDDIQNLDPETLYFIVNILNKAKIKKVRNQILNLTLPLRV
ncbi:uncharacterized protein METZ01_LOCUS36367 [marine metagenome]|uniref:Uncharacterized protein n=1 Tax=marine metagenome TaxID=408172 RepID=A0A381R1K6_9ZZZZ